MIGKNKILVLRYGANIIEDCIEEHISVIENKGFCWFAKLGRCPAKKTLDSIKLNETDNIILYSRQGCFSCSCSEICIKRPDENMPEYYQELIFDKGLTPSVYFKLDEIKAISTADLEGLVLVKSGNGILDTLYKSMNSFFLVENETLKKEDNKKLTKTAKGVKMVDDSCVYLKNGICNCKSFVNYQYECERPSNCVRQKKKGKE